MAGAHSQRVLTFLSDQGIAVKRKNKVTVDIDRSCEMAQVKVNGKLIMLATSGTSTRIAMASMACPASMVTTAWPTCLSWAWKRTSARQAW